MSLDLYQEESAERVGRYAPVQDPEVSAFDGFLRGAGLATMRNLAKVGRSIDMAGSVGPILKDAFTSGTEAQDRYFKEHDDVFGSAVDAWTPRTNEVGIAGEVAGEVLSMLPLVIASPHLAVGSLQMSTAEDLVRKGVDASKAQAVGAAQGVGLGVGIWMPILGQNLWQRVVLGGAGANVAQGIGMRAAGQILLEGTPAANEFQAFDGKSLTLDTLLGAAFGGLVHLSPAARAQGAAAWERIGNWAVDLSPTQKSALVALRLAQHLNVDSPPGVPASAADVESHVQRVRTAIEQLERGEAVQVSGNDQPPVFEPQPKRMEAAEVRTRELAREGARVAKIEGFEPATPAALAIDYNMGLDPELRGVERRFAAAVLGDVDNAIKQYDKIPASDGGKILNTDIARELSPEYAQSLASRSRYAVAVHEPASALVKEMYARKLTQSDPNALNMVTFTAGGTGAGKTGAIAGTPLASKIAQVSQIVYDTNMNTMKSSVEKIEMALAAGKQVNILWVGRDPIDALKGAIKRAVKIGRTVPLSEHAKTHVGAAAVVERLAERYQGDPNVQFVYLDNAGAKGEVTVAGPELPRSYDFDNLEARLKETLDAEYKKGTIPEHVYQGFAGHAPAAEGGVPGGAGKGEPAGEHAAIQGGRDLAAGVTESKAPAATRGEAEPPPPRGSRGGEAAGAEGTDPVRAAADLIAAQTPDRLVRVGTNADGTPRVLTVKDYLQEARDLAKQAKEDVKLFETAALCLFGRGG